MLHRWFIGWVMLLFGLASAQQPTEVPLRLRYQKGQTLTYKVSLDGKASVISEIGVATDIQFKGELNQQQFVEAVAEDGTATLLITVSGKLNIGMAGTPAPGAPAGQQSSVSEIPTTKVRLKLAPNGRLLEMQPVKEEGDKDKKPMLPPLLQDPFQALTMGAATMALLPAPLPETSVKVGEAWDLTGTANVPMPNGQMVPVKVKGQGKLLSVDRKDDHDYAVTEVHTEVPELGEVVSKAMPFKEMGIEMQAKGKSKTISKNWYDIAQGILTRSEIMAETQMNMLIQMPANIGGGAMSLQSHTKMKGIVELIEVKADSKQQAQGK